MQTELPEVVQRKVATIRQRMVMTDLVAGGMAALGTLIGLMLVAMLIDGWWPLSNTGMRLLSTGVTIALAIGVWCYYLSQLRKSSRVARVVETIDEQVPALEERWQTITTLRATPSGAYVDPAVYRHISTEAAQLDHLVDPEQVVSQNKTYRRARLVGIGVILLGAWLAYSPQHVWLLLRRYCAPTADIPQTTVTARSGNLTAARGEPFELVARIAGRRVPRSELSLCTTDGIVERREIRASAVDQDQFSYLFQGASDSMEYRWRAGDGQTDWYRVTVANRPEIAELILTVTPPAYSGREPESLKKLPRTLNVLYGSTVRLVIKPDRPISTAILDRPQGAHVKLRAAEDGSYQWQDEPHHDVVLSVTLIEEHGLRSRRPAICQLKIDRDQAPTVRITNPHEAMEVRPDDEVEISYSAKDDLGIARAELLVYRGATIDPNEPPVVTIPLPLHAEIPQREIHGRAQLNLAEFDLKEGESLSYAVRVHDTRSQLPSDGARPGTEMASPKDTPPEASPSEQPLSSATRTPLKEMERPSDESPASSAISTTGDVAKTIPPAPSGPVDRSSLQVDQSEPLDSIELRLLDIPTSASSQRLQLKVDSWTVSQQTHKRHKLEIAIAPAIEELDRLLSEAEAHSREVVADIDSEKGDPARQRQAIAHARDPLFQGIQTVIKLEKTTRDTPYAFIGLQLRDIVDSLVHPADEHLMAAEAVGGAARRNAVERAWHLISLARDNLAQLTEQFERVRRDHGLADAIAEVKNMYRVFVEDAFELLQANAQPINAYQRTLGEFNLDEEYLARLREVVEMRRKLRAEIARLLASDPRLLRRFNQLLRSRTESIRDQLTLLTERQAALHAEMGGWLSAPAARSARELEIWQRLMQEAVDISERASQLQESFEIWLPLDIGSDGQTVKRLSELVTGIATEARKMAAASLAVLPQDGQPVEGHPYADRIKPVIAQGNSIYQQLKALDIGLRELQVDGQHAELLSHAVNRLVDTRKLMAQHGGWLRRIEEISAGRMAQLWSLQQRTIATDTGLYVDKLAGLEETLSETLGEELKPAWQQLVTLLDRDTAPAQLKSVFRLSKQEVASGHEACEEALATMRQAEELMDDIFVRAIKKLDSLPLDDPIASLLEDPTLDELLAALERETQLLEDLGIPQRPTNLDIAGDWIRPGSATGGSGGTMGPIMTHQFRATRRKIDNAQSNARRRAQDNAVISETIDAVAFKKPEVFWNTLGSRLDDRLLQTDGQQPPEAYRRAIEQYFRQLSRLKNENE